MTRYRYTDTQIFTALASADKEGDNMIKITAKEAQAIAKRLNLQIEDDGLTFYATDDSKSELFSFDSKKEREDFINGCN